MNYNKITRTNQNISKLVILFLLTINKWYEILKTEDILYHCASRYLEYLIMLNNEKINLYKNYKMF